LVGFIGEPRFTAIRLPAKAKVTVDGFELPADADVGEMDWALAKSIKVVYGNGKKTGIIPLEEFLDVPLTSSADAAMGRTAVWSDLLREEDGKLRPKVPDRGLGYRKDLLRGVGIEAIRRGRLAVEGYEALGKFYSQAERPKAEPV